MNSLTELNNYNNSLTLSYTDVRIPGLRFSNNTATNQTTVVNEGATFESPNGIQITEIINPEIVQAAYIIDITGAPEGTDVSWSTVPDGCEVTNVTPTIYKITGITSVTIWNQIKNPNIELPTGIPNGFFGSFTYSAELQYIDGISGSLTKSWLISVSVLDVTVLNSPLEFIFATNDSNSITYAPNIVYDTPYPGRTWTLVATPSVTTAITNWSSSYSGGGTFTFNNSTKSFTVVGTTSQINSHMNALTLISSSTSSDFILSYSLTDNLNTVSDNKTQSFKNFDIQYLSNPSSVTVYYTEDSNGLAVTGTPLITDSEASSYVLEIYPTNADAIIELALGGTGGTLEYDDTLKKIMLHSDKNVINTRLASLTLIPATDYDLPIYINYKITTDTGFIAIKSQTLICNSNDVEITGMDSNRSYLANNENLIFSSSTPQITDFDDDVTNSYTISFQSTLGEWSVDGFNSSNPLLYTGTKAQINSIFSTIKFYPTAGVSSNGTFTYQQFKNGNLQSTKTVNLLGSSSSFTPRVVDIITTGTWQPYVSDWKYGKISDLLIVGGGGGGSSSNGGGGGGGQVKEFTNITITDQIYSMTVGIGGSVNNNGNTTSAFGYTALGGGAGNGWNGGYSYASDGTQIAGGAGGARTYTSTGHTISGGGGGAGSGKAPSPIVSDWDENNNYYYLPRPTSGGRITYKDLTYRTIDIATFPPPGINTVITTYNASTQVGSGGLGSVLTGYFKITSGSGHLQTSNTGYGFGAGAGAVASPSNSEYGGNLGGYHLSSSDGYGRGAFYSPAYAFNAVKPDRYVNGVRDPSIAGGGGGGSSSVLTTAAPGGDGIIRFRIVGK